MWVGNFRHLIVRTILLVFTIKQEAVLSRTILLVFTIKQEAVLSSRPGDVCERLSQTTRQILYSLSGSSYAMSFLDS